MADAHKYEVIHIRKLLNTKGITTFFKLFEKLDKNQVISLPGGIKVIYDERLQWFYYKHEEKKIQICPYKDCKFGYTIGRMCTHLRDELSNTELKQYMKSFHGLTLFDADIINTKDIKTVVKLVRNELAIEEECTWKAVCNKLAEKENLQLIFQNEKIVATLQTKESTTIQISTKDFSFFKCANSSDVCYNQGIIQSGIDWFCKDHVQNPKRFTVTRHLLPSLIYPIVLIASRHANDGKDMDLTSISQWINTLRFLFGKGSNGFGMLTEVASVKLMITKAGFLEHTFLLRHSSSKNTTHCLCIFPHCLLVIDSCNQADKNKRASGSKSIRNRLCALHKEQTQLPSEVAEIYRGIDYDGSIVYL